MAKTRNGVALGTPLVGRKARTRAAPGRLCAEPGCSTILSTYNSSFDCWLHARPSFRRPLDE
jgi:hypothetical protein